MNLNRRNKGGRRVIKSEKGGIRSEILFLLRLFCVQDSQEWRRAIKNKRGRKECRNIKLQFVTGGEDFC